MSANNRILTDEEQQANVAKVRGTVVTLRRYLGKKSPKTAHIVDYVAPCVWKLDREIGSPKSVFHSDSQVCLLNGEQVVSLISD